MPNSFSLGCKRQKKDERGKAAWKEKIEEGEGKERKTISKKRLIGKFLKYSYNILCVLFYLKIIY